MTGKTASTCPFCNKTGKFTKEHVWAQWLRNHGFAYGLWAKEFQGQRRRGGGRHVTLDEGGVATRQFVDGPAASQFLPTVTLRVCSHCNSGWMNRLEIEAQCLLKPVFEGGTTALGVDDQHALAKWAAKSIFAYSRATRPPDVDPFPRSELKRLSKNGPLSSRWRIWLGYCAGGVSSHMSMGIFAHAMGHPGFDFSQIAPANVADCYLAANGVVLLGHWLPEHFPEDLTQRFYDALFPPEAREGLLRIWPPTNESIDSWPAQEIPPLVWEQQRLLMHEALLDLALPEAGLTADQRRSVSEAFLAGADPGDLRKQWPEPAPRLGPLDARKR